jgi:hypothetical protein
MKRQFSFRNVFQGLLILFAALGFFVPTAVALAHGSTTVGDYELEIGFKNEPALQDELNGLDLLVSNSKTGKPVTGLEETLQAEIIFGASKKTLKIEPVEGEEGAYTAAFIPSEVGDYTWHIFGKIEETPVDISMTSSPTTFDSVEPRSSVAFPSGEPSLALLRAELRRARITAVVAVVLGGIGLLLGVAALVMAVTRGKGISVQ